MATVYTGDIKLAEDGAADVPAHALPDAPRVTGSAVKPEISPDAIRPEAGGQNRGNASVKPPVSSGEVAQNRVAAGEATDEDRNLSFEQIHKKYHAKIYNLIFRMVGDAEDAEDLTLETFVNAYKHWDRFRGEARVSTWLHQIAFNNCKNKFKQRDRRREREPISLDDSIETDSGELSREVADWRAAPESLLLSQEFRQRVEKAVDALPPEYREVLILALQEDFSYEEIAEITKLSVPAVKTRLHRARNKVKQRLEPYLRG